MKKTRGFEIYQALVERCPGPSPSVSPWQAGPHIACAGVWLLVWTDLWMIRNRTCRVYSSCFQNVSSDPGPAQSPVLKGSSCLFPASGHHCVSACICSLPAGPLCPLSPLSWCRCIVFLCNVKPYNMHSVEILENTEMRWKTIHKFISEIKLL